VLALANMLSVRMTEKHELPARARSPTRPPQKTETAKLRSFTADLKAEGIHPETVDASIYPNVAVMVLHFTDPASMALRPSNGVRSLTHEIVRRAQQAAQGNDIPYLKLVGHDLCAA